MDWLLFAQIVAREGLPLALALEKKIHEGGDMKPGDGARLAESIPATGGQWFKEAGKP